jgi:hypothetical protein
MSLRGVTVCVRTPNNKRHAAARARAWCDGVSPAGRLLLQVMIIMDLQMMASTDLIAAVAVLALLVASSASGAEHTTGPAATCAASIPDQPLANIIGGNMKVLSSPSAPACRALCCQMNAGKQQQCGGFVWARVGGATTCYLKHPGCKLPQNKTAVANFTAATLVAGVAPPAPPPLPWSGYAAQPQVRHIFAHFFAVIQLSFRSFFAPFLLTLRSLIPSVLWAPTDPLHAAAVAWPDDRRRHCR